MNTDTRNPVKFLKAVHKCNYFIIIVHILTNCSILYADNIKLYSSIYDTPKQILYKNNILDKLFMNYVLNFKKIA